jgi:hypothetical protein
MYFIISLFGQYNKQYIGMAINWTNILLLTLIVTLVLIYMQIKKHLLSGSGVNKVEQSVNDIAAKLNQIGDLKSLVSDVKTLAGFVQKPGEISNTMDEINKFVENANAKINLYSSKADSLNWEKMGTVVDFAAGAACKNADGKGEIQAVIPVGFFGKVPVVGDIPPNDKTVKVLFEGDGLRACSGV